MLLHNKQRINTKKKYLAGFIKLLDAFMSTPHPPYCNILTNKKRCRLASTYNVNTVEPRYYVFHFVTKK